MKFNAGKNIYINTPQLFPLCTPGDRSVCSSKGVPPLDSGNMTKCCAVCPQDPRTPISFPTTMLFVAAEVCIFISLPEVEQSSVASATGPARARSPVAGPE